MNLGALVTLLKGGLGGIDAKQFLAVAKSMGWDLRWQELTDGQRPLAFQRASVAAVEPEAKVLAVSGIGKTGERVEALLVFVPAENSEKKA